MALGAPSGVLPTAPSRAWAWVFLTGRTRKRLEGVARGIRTAGGVVETAQVDPLDQGTTECPLRAVIRKAGRLDISLNAVWIRGNLQGGPLLQMPCDDFMTAGLTGVRMRFLTATAAARQLAKQVAGVILTLPSSSAGLSGRDRRSFQTGGFSTACAAVVAFTRSLAGEVGPQGVRVVSIMD